MADSFARTPLSPALSLAKSLNTNPYETPSTIESRTTQRFDSVISYLATSFVCGANVGAAAVFCYLIFVVVPFWGPPMYKGDERMEFVLFFASTILPICVCLGILSALGGFWFVPFRLGHRQILSLCIPLWILITVMTPAVSRVRRPDIPSPKYETVPETMAMIVCLIFAVTFASGLVKWMSNSNAR